MVSRPSSDLSYRPASDVLDETNAELLRELQTDPRMRHSALARRVGMSQPAVTERVRRLEESGVIRGYYLDLDPAALGLPLTAFIRVRPHPGLLTEIVALAQSIPEIVECHRIVGEDGFLLKVYLPAIDQLDRILDRFLLLGTTTTSIVHATPIPLRSLPIAVAES